MDAQHLYLVPPECNWDGRGEEPSCDSVPAMQRAMRRPPHIPEDDELAELAEELQSQIQVLMPDAAWLQPLWMSAHFCVHEKERCTSDVLNFMWRNLAMLASRLISTTPSPEVLELAIQYHSIALWLEADEATYQRLVTIYASVGREGDAARTVQEAIALNAVSPEMLDQLGMGFHNHQMWAPALFAFKASHMLSPNASTALNHLVYLRKRCADWDGINEQMAQMVTKVELSWTIHTLGPAEAAAQLQEETAHPWIFLYFPVSMVTKRVVAQRFALRERTVSLMKVPQLPQIEDKVQQEKEKILSEVESKSGAAKWRTSKRRLRVGFVSADFRRKATSYLIAHLFEHIDRSQLEVFVYSTFPDDRVSCDWRVSIEEGAEHFVDLAGIPEPQAVARIRKDQLDIMLDLDGYSNQGQRLASVFASRIAPLQIGYFVYIGSYGSSFIDYIISDTVASPPSSSAGHVEKFLYIPNTFFPNSHKQIYPPPHFGLQGIDRMAMRQTLGVADDTFVLASFNKHLKLSQEMFQTWLDILEAVPSSVLWLLRFPRDSEPNIRKEAARRGLSHRIMLSDFVDTAEGNFQRLAAADLMLDTSVYGSHTTAVDALWAQVGLLTCLGSNCTHRVEGDAAGYATAEFDSAHTRAIGADHMTARIAASMVIASGLDDELVVTSLEEYKERAVSLATNRSRMEVLRTRLAESRMAPDGMWDTKAYAKRLVKGLRLAWENFLAGNEPMHLSSL
eukprot:CAMPEP_0198229818 /NCGR_PEP_ID=MMETSP1445-20131203/114322_1 /TAXON_ID=36898 /ORGANISM="Pyramimonas sp., Strain CCMP2087" /LENGTH=735 /DNA_ID=CAMNT_0043910293 /DNA_START=97 /DNA_END=2304 /DNA_ORIENTATION=+